MTSTKSQMPHIERALANGYEVLVLSTNVNVWPDVRPNSAVPVQHVPVYRQLQLQCTLYTTDFYIGIAYHTIKYSRCRSDYYV